MKGILVFEGTFPHNCTGCRTCELICSLTHAGAVNSTKSRIRVLKRDRFGFAYPVVCIQCADPECAKVCPVGALTISTGVVVVDREICIGCGKCEAACPIGAIAVDPDLGAATKCDLCGGSPRCVEWCPRGILRLCDHRDSVPDFAPRELLDAEVARLRELEAGDAL